jgi:hypothetical protein
LNRRPQEIPVRARGNDGLNVRQILCAAGEQLHDDNGVDWRNRNACTHAGTGQPVFHDA